MRVKKKKSFSIFGTFNEKNIFLMCIVSSGRGKVIYIADKKKMLLTVFNDENVLFFAVKRRESKHGKR